MSANIFLASFLYSYIFRVSRLLSIVRGSFSNLNCLRVSSELSLFDLQMFKISEQTSSLRSKSSWDDCSSGLLFSSDHILNFIASITANRMHILLKESLCNLTWASQSDCTKIFSTFNGAMYSS